MWKRNLIWLNNELRQIKLQQKVSFDSISCIIIIINPFLWIIINLIVYIVSISIRSSIIIVIIIVIPHYWSWKVIIIVIPHYLHWGVIIIIIILSFLFIIIIILGWPLWIRRLNRYHWFVFIIALKHWLIIRWILLKRRFIS